MDITELIKDIKRMKARNAFKQYIEYIQFPYFRNLNRNTRITFDFPLTVFVGQNGSGKSSTLHALFGAPKRKTPYEFWFSTAVDPIQEVSDGGDRHCFFYVYKDPRGNELEVLKLRIFKRNNPDYWETSRPVAKYGMRILPEKKRNEPLEKEVVYIDFRSELSAFDKYFYFKKPKQTKTIKTRQDYLRKYSVYLKKVIDRKEKIFIYRQKPRNEPLKEFNNEELGHISNILGKKYVSGQIVFHNLFDEWGYSVIFKTDNYSYSEAFAGSGEMAVVRLVLEILNAKAHSLILLDEPEVSLHPGAQKRLKYFLLEQARKKQFQVVISTHSPSLIEELPSDAIKVFSQLPNGKFSVKNDVTPEEAFFHLEQTNPTKKLLIVEDFLSKLIIEGVLREIGEDTKSLFQVTFFTGGASVIKTNFINIFSQANELNKFIIFDGDQKHVEEHFDPDQLIIAEQTNDRFKEEIKTQTNCDVQFFPDGNPIQGARVDQEKELRKNYLKFYLRNVFYLPKSIPEEIIWNQDFAENLLAISKKNEYILRINELENYKEKFSLVAEALTGDKKDIDSSEKIFLEKWLVEKNQTFNEIAGMISTIRDLQING
ncbi:MAG TPA: AAA family ATPase [Segetibacter sp.]|jgi:predicted ATPase